MVKPLKLAIAGVVVALALLSANLTMRTTPTADAQSPYCAVNPTVCTPAFCATYPGICNVISPIYPVGPCGYVNCISPISPINCAPVPYSPIYGFRPCTYPIAPYPLYPACNFNTPCNGPFVGGAPARVNLAVSPAIATCGSTPVTVSANVTDAFGVAVANGTLVSFSSTIGSIGSATTIGGNATATLSIPNGSAAGVAQIRVTAGGASASTTVQVNCAPVVVVQQQQVVVARPSQATVIYRPGPQTRPAPQQPVIIQRGPPPAAIPPFAPPRTGEAGLTDAILAPTDDGAANQALVDSWREAEYGVLDASQYDWIVTPDDSAASTTLATDLASQAYSVIDASQVDVAVVADDSAATTTLVTEVLSNPTDFGN
jgi:hypothetical protein